jgi:lysophospholipase L1-like esterase
MSTATRTLTPARAVKRRRLRVDPRALLGLLLVVISIGGNDVTACARVSEPVPCVAEAVKTIDANVRRISKRLRKAAGRKVPMVGITYPDVILGQWVTGKESDQNLAKLSIVAFKSLINPTLKKAYASRKIRFADVTRATGAYGSFDRTRTVEPYGELPAPVARICELSFYCRFRDIHLRTKGYRIVAREVAERLPRR